MTPSCKQASERDAKTTCEEEMSHNSGQQTSRAVATARRAVAEGKPDEAAAPAQRNREERADAEDLQPEAEADSTRRTIEKRGPRLAGGGVQAEKEASPKILTPQEISKLSAAELIDALTARKEPIGKNRDDNRKRLRVCERKRQGEQDAQKSMGADGDGLQSPHPRRDQLERPFEFNQVENQSEEQERMDIDDATSPLPEPLSKSAIHKLKKAELIEALEARRVNITALKYVKELATALEAFDGPRRSATQGSNAGSTMGSTDGSLRASRTSSIAGLGKETPRPNANSGGQTRAKQTFKTVLGTFLLDEMRKKFRNVEGVRPSSSSNAVIFSVLTAMCKELNINSRSKTAEQMTEAINEALEERTTQAQAENSMQDEDENEGPLAREIYLLNLEEAKLFPGHLKFDNIDVPFIHIRERYNAKPDGNCFHNCTSYVFTGGEGNADLMRTLTADYLERAITFQLPWLLSAGIVDEVTDVNLLERVRQMRTRGFDNNNEGFGTIEEFGIVARLTKTNFIVCVHDGDKQEFCRFPAYSHFEEGEMGGNLKLDAHTAVIDYIRGSEHFQVVTRIDYAGVEYVAQDGPFNFEMQPIPTQEPTPTTPRDQQEQQNARPRRSGRLSNTPLKPCNINPQFINEFIAKLDAEEERRQQDRLLQQEQKKNRDQENRRRRKEREQMEKLQPVTDRCHGPNALRGCAALSSNHARTYSDIGGFSYKCPWCSAKLMKAEFEAITRKTPAPVNSRCCSSGKIQTQKMKELYNSLMDPIDAVKELRSNYNSEDPQKRKDSRFFLENTRHVNSKFAMASVTTVSEEDIKGKPSRRTDKPGSLIKINGERMYRTGNAMPDPDNHEAVLRFEKLYTLDPAAALKLRTEGDLHIPLSVAKLIQDGLLSSNIFCQMYRWAGDKIVELEEDYKEKGLPVPRMELILLSNRQADEAGIRDPHIHPHRSENMDTSEAVAVIWDDAGSGKVPPMKNKDGSAAGFRMCTRGGEVREIPGKLPIVAPLCYPIIHTKGELGYTFGIAMKLDDHEEQPMTEEPPQVPNDDHPEDDAILSDDEELEREFDADEGEQTQQPEQPKKREFVSETAFHRYLMAYRKQVNPEEDAEEDVELELEADSEELKQPHYIWSLRSLGQQYAILVRVNIERNTLDFATQGQLNKRHMLSADLIKALEAKLNKEKKEVLGKVVFAPVTWKGSTRHMQRAYADATKVFEEYGNPNLFITFTLAPDIPEITSQLRPGETYVDRPELVARIFKIKMEELLHDLLVRAIFGKVVAYTLSVEHQKRGMPHLHILLTLDKKVPTNDPAWVDDYISGEIPDLPDEDDHSEEADQQRRYHSLVIEKLLHSCEGKNGQPAPCRTDMTDSTSAECKKHFPKPHSTRTILDTGSYPIYKRLSPQDGGNTWTRPSDGKVFTSADVVTNNRYLTLKYGTHINVEAIGPQKCLEYVMKYVLKGHDVAYVRARFGKEIRPNKDGEVVIDYNEIEEHFIARIMSAIEAMCRLEQVPVTKLSHTVLPLYIHAEKDGPIITFNEGEEENALEQAKRMGTERKSTLTAYFKLCADPNEKNSWLGKKDKLQGPAAIELRFEQIPYYYIWKKKEKVWQRRSNRKMKNPMLIRLGSVNAGNAEMVAMRLLLMVTPGVKSFEHLRTVPGEDKPRDSFVEVAVERGLLASMEMWYSLFTDAFREMKGAYQVRRFFVRTIVTSSPPDPMALVKRYLNRLAPPRAGESEEVQLKRALKHLEYFLRKLYDKTCKDVGLNVASDYNQEEMDELYNRYANPEDPLYDEYMTAEMHDWKKIAEDAIKIFNEGQRKIFDTVQRAVRSGKQELLFVQGGGGSGKTTLFNGIIADQKAKRKCVISTASTGVAAILLYDGRTAHTAFKIPLDNSADEVPKVDPASPIGQKIRDADVIILDEISMLHKTDFEFIDRQVRDLCVDEEKKRLPFAGKVVLISGDFKQLTPVVSPNGNRAKCVSASVKRSRLFHLFKKCKLTQNMRTAPSEVVLRELLQKIGLGLNFKKMTDKQGRELKTDYIDIPAGMQVADVNELINSTFPPEALRCPLLYAEKLAGSAILCPTNDNVDELNELIMQKIDKPAQEYLSHDEILAGNPIEMLTNVAAHTRLEYVNTLRPGNLPPHKLKLKVGCIVMLTRNLSLDEGLCNGTRLQVLELWPQMLHCKILTGPKAGTKTLIGKARFEHGTKKSDRGIAFTRLQFPVRIAFAMTINKSQGQTLDRMGLSLTTQQVFSHGHIYVAFSRVRTMEGIKVLTQTADTPLGCIVNIVWPELIRDEIEEQAEEQAEDEQQDPREDPQRDGQQDQQQAEPEEDQEERWQDMFTGEWYSTSDLL